MSLSELRGALSALRKAAPPHRVFAVFGLLALLAVIVATPPFMNPDEPLHFKRAYGVSKGELIAAVRDGRPGVEAPVSIDELIASYFYPNRSLPLPLADTARELRRPLEPGRTAFLPLRPDALYAPIGYAPQAVAMAAGRLVGAGPLWLLYLARLGNALACVALVAGALRIMRAGREVSLLIACLPMSLALMASASPDGLTLSGGLLFAALLGRCLEDDRWSPGRLAMIGLSGALLCATKIVYVPALAAGAVYLLSPAPWPRRLRVVGVQALMALAVALAAIWWLKLVDVSSIDAREGVDAARQLRHVLDSPIGFLGVMIRSMVSGAAFLTESAFGVLGWTNVFLPKWAYGLIALAVPLGLLASRDRPAPLSPLACLWIALLLGVVVALVEFALYIVWTPVGRPLIEGVQGRYFLPVAPLAGVMLTSFAVRLRRFVDPDACYSALLVSIVLSTAAMGLTLVRFFGLFQG